MSGRFDQILYTSMFLLAFNACARIGEITVGSTDGFSKVLQKADLSYIDGSNMSITFRFYKHNATGTLYTIHFSHGPTTVSAVHILIQYLKNRGNHDGPLFYLRNQTPVSRTAFDKQLRRTLAFCGLDGSRYEGHSFG